MNLNSPTFFNRSKLCSDCLSVCLPSSMAEHIRHGCFPSKVVPIAAATEVVTERETSIPVHAVACNTTQCAPLRYRAQHRTRSLCRGGLTLNEFKPLSRPALRSRAIWGEALAQELRGKMTYRNRYAGAHRVCHKYDRVAAMGRPRAAWEVCDETCGSHTRGLNVEGFPVADHA